VRLFTALWLPDDAAGALREVVDPDAPPPGWRAVDPASWHVTLAFHGEADPGVHARRLDGAVRGAPPPRLRLEGAGAFDGVRWAGVRAEPGERLAELVGAVGGDPGRFVGHVTVLRRRARPGRDADPDPPTAWADHRGPWWAPPEVLLVSSEPGRAGARYRVVHRVPLASG
jgi:RNA 2',3'-cyclic 3'-phosphodiesterase